MSITDVFHHYFNHANVTKFYIYHDKVMYMNKVDISNVAFWNNPTWVSDLNMSIILKYRFEKFGPKKFMDALKVYYEQEKLMRNKFLAKYPGADPSMFDFNVNLNKDTLELISKSVNYRVNDSVSYDITSETFKNKYSDMLLWQPRLWSGRGTVSSTLTLTRPSLSFDVTKFEIFVNKKQYFFSNFEPLDTKWENKSESKDITTAFNDTDPYFVSLLAAYVISYKAGISRKHFEYSRKTPYIITSIARYYIYYHMKRFLRDPTKLQPYLTKEIKALVKANVPVKKIWKEKFAYGMEIPLYWHNKHPNKDNIRNVRADYYSTGGQMGIRYEEVDSVVNNSDNDWMSFIKKTSDGLTPTGQKLLQEAIESYVYCVLDAQAETRWAIVGAGAKSIQTQGVFEKLVKDTITVDSAVLAISNMRKAIKSTNVVLNMVVSPDVILIPSDMIIVKQAIPGFNNTLTLAKSSMRFGVNSDINAPKVTTHLPTTPEVKQRGHIEVGNTSSNSNEAISGVIFITTGVLTLLVFKLVM